MKTVSLPPSEMMRIICPECGHEHDRLEKKPPLENFAFKCGKCGADFMVNLDFRNFYRKAVNIPCYYTTAMDVSSIMDSRVTTGWITDISRTGCAIEFSKLKPSTLNERKNNILLIFFSFHGQKDVFSIQGKVMAIYETTSKIKMGVQFINVSEHHRQRLSLFLMP
ncbi:MAG TPA: PilZ domain-containing protein [Dissulfurispiraceae bacterium]|nr:PilZ domain-containing protein [Dissulfurispiraceae bacterium]